jgi:hypothetical protein
MSSQLQVTGEAKIRDIQGPVVANSGVITALDGAASQYVRGDGTLADFPTSSGGGSSVSYYLNSSVSQGTIGGVAYRELSKEPIIGAGTDIAISTTGYVASYLTDANDPDVLSIPGGNFNCEFYFSVNNNTGDPFFYAELYKYDGTTFTLLGSSVGVPEYINQGTIIAPYYFAIPVATAALALTDRLAIRIYVNVDGRTVTLHTENGHLCQVVTTLSKGMVSLNNLTDQSQFITTGTSGTNFNIVSSGDTHTFNLPVASAANTGKLSSSDWSVFNAKEPAITAGTTLQYYRGDKTFQTLDTTAVIEATNLYFTDARARAALSFAAGSGAYNSTTGVITIPTNTNQLTNGASFITLTSLSAGTGISYNNTTGVITNSAPDQTVSLTAGAGISITGTYPSFTIASTITQYTDALARAAISLTTTGSSGESTYNNTTGILNVPNYTLSGLGGVPSTRTITINGTSQDLSADRTYNVGTITGSGGATEIPYFSTSTALTSEAAFNYDASLNRLGVNTSVPNATIGADSALDSGYGLLIKTGASNYNGIGIAIDSTYGNLISTEKLGSATARNLTLLNQSGFVSLKENGNFGVNTLNPSVSGTGIDIYGSTSTSLRLHTATSGTTVTDGAGINFSAANNLGITNYENVTNGNSGVFVATNGFVGINGATPSVALTVNGSASISNLTTGQVLFPTSGGTLSGTNSLFWDNATDSLRIGSNTSANRRLSIFSSSDANHFALISNAPAITLSNNFSYTYYATVGMATASNNFVAGAVAGDLVLGAFNTSSIIFTNANTNTQRMKLTSGGDLVIGATSADTKLDVRGEISLSYSADNGLRFYNQDRSNWSSIGNNTATGTSNANLVFRTSAGTALTIAANRNTTFATAATFSSSVAVGGANNTYGFLDVWKSGSSIAQLSIGQNATYHTDFFVDTSGNFYVQPQGNTRLTILSGGNVGIGNSNASNKLSVLANGSTSTGADSSAGFVIYGDTEGSWMSARKTSATPSEGQFGTDSIGTFLTSLTNHPIVFRPANTERMRITSGGLFKFQNNGSTYESGTTGVNEFNTAANDTNVVFRNTAGSLTGARAGVDVFYSAAAPNSTTACFYQAADNAGGRTLRFSVRSNGGIENYTANNIPLSDERLKKDIIPLESVWDKIKNIEIVKYKFKDQTHEDFNMGVIAQQVQKVAPELVDDEGWGTFAEDGTTYKGIWETDLNYYSIKALQEAMDKIEKLEVKIKQLENK